MGKVCFIAMASLHSEVLLVSAKDRALYSWSCASRASPRPHPLAKELGLEGERVALVESSDIRATVVTESGKVATFYDELLRGKFSVSEGLYCFQTTKSACYAWQALDSFVSMIHANCYILFICCCCFLFLFSFRFTII